MTECREGARVFLPYPIKIPLIERGIGFAVKIARIRTGVDSGAKVGRTS
jgi:hypothetical protein